MLRPHCGNANAARYTGASTGFHVFVKEPFFFKLEHYLRIYNAFTLWSCNQSVYSLLEYTLLVVFLSLASHTLTL